MASKPAPKRQPPKLTKNQTELRILKDAGLWSGDWRKAKQPSGAQKRLRKRFAKELSGLANGTIKTVVAKGAKRKEIASDLRLTRGRVLVRATEGEKLKYNPKSKTISAVVEHYGVRYRRIIMTSSTQTLEELPEGKNIRYMVPFRQWGVESPLFSSKLKLAEFMFDYEKDRIRANGKISPGFKEWRDYVEVLERVDKKKPETLMDDGDIIDKTKLTSKKPLKRNHNRSRSK